MRVDHRRRYVLAAERLLHGSDVRWRSPCSSAEHSNTGMRNVKGFCRRSCCGHHLIIGGTPQVQPGPRPGFEISRVVAPAILLFLSNGADQRRMSAASACGQNVSVDCRRRHVLARAVPAWARCLLPEPASDSLENNQGLAHWCEALFFVALGFTPAYQRSPPPRPPPPPPPPPPRPPPPPLDPRDPRSGFGRA